MNNSGQKNVVGGICRPGLPRRNLVKAGAWPVCGVLATKMLLLTEPGGGIERIATIVAAATEWRKRVAHGVSRGLGALFEISSAGAADNIHAFTQFRSPRWGLNCVVPITHGLHRGLLSVAAPQLTIESSK
jgi:hypothetical protein